MIQYQLKQITLANILHVPDKVQLHKPMIIIFSKCYVFSASDWAIPEIFALSPHRGDWISRPFFEKKYSFGFPGFFDKNPCFHKDFKEKNHTCAQNLDIFVFSV